MMPTLVNSDAMIGRSRRPPPNVPSALRAVILGTILSESKQPSAFRTLVRLPSFERSAHGLLREEEHRWIDNTLGADPSVGVVTRGTGGVRKLRIALERGGKSGGARVIYFYSGSKQRVFLLFVYSKREKDNLSAAERKEMRRLTAVLEAEP